MVGLVGSWDGVKLVFLMTSAFSCARDYLAR